MTPPPDLEALFRQHAPGLAGAVRGILGPGADVQELVQEAFLKAWRAQAAGERPSQPVGWIFVLTLNLARDVRRRRERRGPHLELDDVDEAKLTTGERPETRLSEGETLAAAREAIHALPDEQKEVFLLRTSADLSFAAVAEALGIPVGTAKTRMRAALLQLRQRLAPFSPGAELEGDLR